MDNVVEKTSSMVITTKHESVSTFIPLATLRTIVTSWLAIQVTWNQKSGYENGNWNMRNSTCTRQFSVYEGQSSGSTIGAGRGY